MDHLLSMEYNLIEKQPYENFGARAQAKSSRKKATFDSFYLVLRDHLISQILFFENLIMPVIIYNEKLLQI